MDVPLLLLLEGRRQNVCVKDSVIDCPPVLAFPDIYIPAPPGPMAVRSKMSSFLDSDSSKGAQP